jgi:hypothetical protein
LRQEKQRAYEAKLRAIHGPNAVIPQLKAPAAAASNGQPKPATARQPTPAAAGAAAYRQQHQQSQQMPPQQQPSRGQQPRANGDPYAHLPPKVSSWCCHADLQMRKLALHLGGLILPPSSSVGSDFRMFQQQTVPAPSKGARFMLGSSRVQRCLSWHVHALFCSNAPT